jgi:hypothetical protein
MHRFARIVAPLVATAALLIAGGSQALAVSPVKEDLSDSWCFDDTPWYVYCFDVTGQAQYVDSPSAETVMIHQKTVTTVSQNGVVLGTSTDIVNDKFTFHPDGTTVYHTVTNSMARFADQQCHYQTVLRIADFDWKIEHVNSSCDN